VPVGSHRGLLRPLGPLQGVLRDVHGLVPRSLCEPGSRHSATTPEPNRRPCVELGDGSDREVTHHGLGLIRSWVPEFRDALDEMRGVPDILAQADVRWWGLQPAARPWMKAYLYAHAGRRDEAREQIREALAGPLASQEWPDWDTSFTRIGELARLLDTPRGRARRLLPRGPGRLPPPREGRPRRGAVAAAGRESYGLTRRSSVPRC
jgi:hypothetical protein